MTQKSLFPKQTSLSETLPIMPLLSVVVYPYSIVQLLVRRDRNLNLLEAFKGSDPLVIGLVAPKVQGKEDPGPEDLYSWGVAARVVSRVAIPGGGAQLVLQGLCRIKINKYTSSESFLT